MSICADPFSSLSRLVTCPSHTIVGPATHEEIEQFSREWAPSAQKPAPSGWIWCHLAQATAPEQFEKPAEDQEEKDLEFEKAGGEILKALVQRCREIKETAPARAKKGAKSQKALRDEEYARFQIKIKDLAQQHHVLSGKWLFFPHPDALDRTWSKIVKALANADGTLARTGVVSTAKVASMSMDGEAQVICVYVNDSWDREAVEKALRCLVEDVQVEPSAYKCDAFTILGIDSKHESGIRSSLYSKFDFMTDTEIKAALAREPKGGHAKAVRKKTLQDELEEGLGDFDEVSSSEDEEPASKRRKA